MRPRMKISSIDSMKEYYTNYIKQEVLGPYLLNITLTSNPFFRDQEKFHYLNYMLSQYNKRVANQQVQDTYQAMSYQQLHRLLSDLSQIETKQDQINRLEQLYQWFKKQQILLKQRKDQGVIRYKVIKEFKDWVPQNKKYIESQQQQKDQIPSQLIAKLMEPYYTKGRTGHSQMEIPPKRLIEYKRKIINIAPFIEQKAPQKATRILYPMPIKPVQPKQQEEQKPQGQLQLSTQLLNSQNKQGEQVKPQEQQQQQDLGGFGQQPQQQQQQPIEQVQDKLAPKVKAYVSAIQSLDTKKYYSGQYLYYKGEDNNHQRSMELKYKNIQENALKKQKQQEEAIKIAHIWAKRKSKMEKQLQKKLQQMRVKPAYTFSQEEPPKIQRINPRDQLKYGLTMPITKNIKNPELDLSEDKLPVIDRHYQLEKNVRKDRLNSLKQKFSKLLNLSEYQSRDVVPSLCQFSPRRRDLSEILRAHSKSKQRLNQLEQITKIKEKMTKNKLGVNLKALSQGLVLPEDEQLPSTNQFPSKNLPNNPFWVEPAKKKKKK